MREQLCPVHQSPRNRCRLYCQRSFWGRRESILRYFCDEGTTLADKLVDREDEVTWALPPEIIIVLTIATF